MWRTDLNADEFPFLPIQSFCPWKTISVKIHFHEYMYDERKMEKYGSLILGLKMSRTLFHTTMYFWWLLIFASVFDWQLQMKNFDIQINLKPDIIVFHVVVKRFINWHQQGNTSISGQWVWWPDSFYSLLLRRCSDNVQWKDETVLIEIGRERYEKYLFKGWNLITLGGC